MVGYGIVHNMAHVAFIVGVLTGAVCVIVGAWMMGWFEKSQCTKHEGVDGETYNAGRLEGHADVCADLRAIIDPDDVNRWNYDGLLREIARRCSVTK